MSLASNAEKLQRKQIDPSANSKGRAGILPTIPDADSALVTLDEAIWGEMQYEWQHGREKGQTTHNRYLDPYFKWMPGYTNVITGWPGHGKSQLFFELLLLRAVFTGKKSAVWPSENLPARRFFQKLLHTLTGKPTDRFGGKDHLTLPEMARAKDFIREHFILLDPPAGLPYTPAHMLAYFEAAIGKYGGADDKYGIAHCLLDPWNKCDHTAKAKMGGDEPYLVHTVGLCTKWSPATRQSLVLTAHPRRADENMGYGKSRPVPSGGMISGGQTWENMAHYVGGVHRPFDFIEGNTQAAFYSLKCKDEEDVARRGSLGYLIDGQPPKTPINWDPITNRFRWGVERWSPLDDEKVKRLYATSAETPAPQLFTTAPAPKPAPTAAAPTPPAPLPASTDFGHDDEPPTERFGPRIINSNSLQP